MSYPLVTVGLCVRNCEKTVGKTLGSIISQDYPHNLMEIIVVDDGCTDKTISIIVKKLSKADINFKVLRTEGSGLGAARQKVVDHAKGKYIIWIDGDMMVPSEYIHKQVEFMELNPRIGRARAKRGWFNAGKVLSDLQFLTYAYEIEKGAQSKFSGIGGSICRVDAIKDIGGFDVCIKGAGEDIDLAIRMLARGWGFSVSDTIFYHKPKTSWKDFWKQNIWYGYGAHYVNHKHKKHIGVTLLMPVALAVSIKKAVAAFKFTGMKRSFLLPLLYLFGSFAWWIGYAKAHFDKYIPPRAD